MDKIFGLLIIFFCTSFINQTGHPPRLTKLKITYDHDACSAPTAIFDLNQSDQKLTFSFGYDEYFEKQDTINYVFKNDSLFIKIIKRNKPRIVVENGIVDTLPGRRSDPDCECNSLFRLEFSGVSKTPKGFVIDKYVHDNNLGFVELNRLKMVHEKVSTFEVSGKYKLDSLFEVRPQYKFYPNLQDLAWYLRKRGTLTILVIDVDTQTEEILVGRIRSLMIKEQLVCTTRTSPAFERDFLDSDSTSVWVKIVDTKTFKFPEVKRSRH